MTKGMLCLGRTQSQELNSNPVLTFSAEASP